MEHAGSLRGSSRKLFRLLTRLSPLLLIFGFVIGWGGDMCAQRTHAGQQSRQGKTSRPKFAPDRLLVRFRPATSAKQAEAVHARVSAKVARKWKTIEGLEGVELPSDLSVPEAIRRYQEDPAVLYAEPDYLVQAMGAPNDPRFAEQWSLRNTGQDGGVGGADIRATQAWDLTTGSSNVVVAVIDTGIDVTHPDLAPNLFRNTPECTPNGIDDDGDGFVDDCFGAAPVYRSGNPQDDNGHGSHVAGIIGAAGNNSLSVSGVNWNVRVLACKFLDASGYGYTSDAIACLDYVKLLKQRGVPIVATNNSWGGGFYSQALADAIAGQISEGILFVASAGNNFADSDIEPAYPASFSLPNIISVAATNRFDELAGFSNFSRFSVHVGAPGQEVLSTVLNGALASYSGTSMAAPHVTGVAALLKAQDPARDWRSLRNLILSGGQPLPALAGNTVTGRRLDAYGSLTCNNSTVRSRLLPNSNAMPGAVGQPITLAVLNINCAQPAGSVQVTVQPGGQVLTLRDDGIAPDAAAGDGTYTADWAPPALGSYTLVFPGNDAVQVTVLQNYEGVQSNEPYRSIVGTSLDLGDDNVVRVEAPFPIRFGGGSFDNFYVSANGMLSFTNAFSDFQNGNIPVDYWRIGRSDNPPPAAIQAPVVTLVAPFWDDLNPLAGTNENIFWEVTGTAPNRELVIEWRDVRAYDCRSDPSAAVRFEVVFKEGSSDVLFLYEDATFGGECTGHDYGFSASVGMQVTPRSGTRWGFSYGPSLAVGDNFGLLWRIPPANPPNNPVPTITSISPDPIELGSGDLMVTITGTGFVPGVYVELYPIRQVTYYRSSTEVQFFVRGQDLTIGLTIVNVINPGPGGGGASTLIRVVPPGGGVPTLDSITPDTVPAASFSFIMTLRGTNFYRDTSIVWDRGIPNSYVYNWAAQYISPNEIQAAIPAYLVLDPGTVTIRTSNGPDKESNSLTFTITASASGGSILAPGLPSSSTPNGLPAAPSAGQSGQKGLQFPLRFQGWKAAEFLGREYLQRFVRPRANLALSPPTPAVGSAGTVAAVSSAQPPLTSFEERTRIPADYLPSAVETGDFNGDGHVDWVIANGGSDSLWLYLGRGDASWELPRVIPLKGYSPLDVKAADMDGDGKLDLIVAEADSGTIGVLLGKGDGTFGTELRAYTPGNPLSLAVADFNADGKLDVVAGQFSVSYIGPLAFLPGLGGGRLGTAQTYYGQTQSGWYFMNPIRVADLDNDGLPDIVGVELMFSPLGGGINPGSQLNTGAQAYLNQGNGQFKRIQLFDISHGGYYGPGGNIHVVHTVALGDANRDGCVDAVTVDYYDLALFFPGRCDGTFDTQQSRLIGTGTAGGNAALADMNGDGNLDLVVSGFFQHEFNIQQTSAGHVVSVAFGDGAGRFSAPRVYRGLPGMFSFAFADFNEDSHPDLMAIHEEKDAATLYLNDGSGGFGSPRGSYTGYLLNRSTPGVSNSAVTPFAHVDVNADGRKDLVYVERGVTSPQPGTLSVLLNEGNEEFAAPIRSSLLDTGSSPFDITFADFRNTGRPDALLLSSVGVLSYYALAKNNGDGSFQITGSKFFNDIFPELLITGDFNGDGQLDFVAPANTIVIIPGYNYSNVTPRLVPFLGNGDGTFTRGADQVLNPPAGVTSYLGYGFARDLNKDGKLDLLMWGTALINATDSSAIYALFGNGDGTFQAPRLLLNNFNYFTLADVNEDGRDDIVEIKRPATAAYYPLEYAVFLGQADGTFQPGATYGPMFGEFSLSYLFGTPAKPLKPGQPMVADFNGDGHLDIAGFQALTASFPDAGFISSGYTGTMLQILAGRGDGTFIPSYVPFDVGRVAVPQLAADMNGDGRADLVEFNTFSGSYNILHSKPGPSFSIAPVNDPVLGTRGKMRVILANASGNDTVVQIAASDADLSVPSSIAIPAGALSTDFEYTIGSGFDPLRVFTIQASVEGESHKAYITQARPDQYVGIYAGLSYQKISTPRGNASGNFALFVYSLGGYSTELEISCNGLPAEAACQLSATKVVLPSGSLVNVSVQIIPQMTLPAGDYNFTIQVTDGDRSQQLPATLSISDFRLSLTPPSQTVGMTGFVTYSLNVEDLNGFPGSITISCSQGLPPGALCSADGFYVFPGVGAGLRIMTDFVTPGTYTFTVTGTSAGLVRTTIGTLVVDPGNVTGSITPSSASVNVGGSATFSVSLFSQNGSTGTYSPFCDNAPMGITCTFSPNMVRVSPGSGASMSLRVSVSSMPSAVPPASGVRNGPRLVPEHMLWSSVLLLALLLAIRVRSRGPRLAPTVATLALALLAFGMASCGGGGSSSSPPPPSSQPTRVTLKIRANSGTVTIDVATVILYIR